MKWGKNDEKRLQLKEGEASAWDVAKIANYFQMNNAASVVCLTEYADKVESDYVRHSLDGQPIISPGAIAVWVSDGKHAQCVWRAGSSGKTESRGALPTWCLAFLAARFPAAYRMEAIVTRVREAQLTDQRVTAYGVEAALCGLVDKGLVVELFDAATQDRLWQATVAGIRQWNVSGRLHIN